MDKKGKSDPFVQEILKHAPVDTSIDELLRIYDSEFPKTAKRYQRFTTVPDPMVMETIDE